MARLLKNIDKIGREQQRDVIFIDFNKKVFRSRDYKNYKGRAELLQWLEEHNISYEDCFPIASDNGFEAYRGSLYINLIVDETSDIFRLLRDHLETPDEVYRFEGIEFWILPLAIAMQNSYMDKDDYESNL